MSYESNDERIERLENQVAQLLQTSVRSLNFIENGQLQDSRLARMIVLLKNDHTATLRVLVNSSFIKDENVRRQFLGQISRLESDCEKMEAMVASVVSRK